MKEYDMEAIDALQQTIRIRGEENERLNVINAELLLALKTLRKETYDALTALFGKQDHDPLENMPAMRAADRAIEKAESDK